MKIVGITNVTPIDHIFAILDVENLWVKYPIMLEVEDILFRYGCNKYAFRESEGAIPINIER